MSFIDENDEVLVAGFGRSGHAVGDLPGVRFRIVKVASVSLYALWLRKKSQSSEERSYHQVKILLISFAKRFFMSNINFFLYYTNITLNLNQYDVKLTIDT